MLSFRPKGEISSTGDHRVTRIIEKILPPDELSADETIWDEKYPYIGAKATDFKEQTRKLKVYFTIKEEKSLIRIIEKRHLKKSP